MAILSVKCFYVKELIEDFSVTQLERSTNMKYDEVMKILEPCPVGNQREKYFLSNQISLNMTGKSMIQRLESIATENTLFPTGHA